MKLATKYWLRYQITTRWGTQSLSAATTVVIGSAPELPALDAPVVTAVLPDNVTVRWPAKPAWFDDATMTDITLDICKQADACGPDSAAWRTVNRFGPAISRKVYLWGALAEWSEWGVAGAAESTMLQPSTSYWLRYQITTRFGTKSLSPATAVGTSALPELPALDAPVVTAVLPDNATVRWPAKPAWFDDATMTEITLVACAIAEICSADQNAVYRFGPATARKYTPPWGALGQWAESNNLKLATSYWLRYKVTMRWGQASWSGAAYIMTGVQLPGAGTQQPTASPSATPTLTSTPTPTITLTPGPSPTPTLIPGLGGYAVIHPDGHVCGVTVATSANPFGNGGTMPVEYMGCPAGSRIVFQTKPSPSGNVAGWHGANVTYSNGVFTITSETDGKISITIQDGIATGADGRVWDTGSGVTLRPANTATPTLTSTPTATPTLTPTLAPSLTPTVAATPLLKLPVTQSFGDVPPTHPYFAHIEALYRAGYTAGCSTSPLLYCPERSMTRAEGAVFVMRGHRGAAYQALAPVKSDFSDVDVANWSAKWAVALQTNGLTAGCSAPTAANPGLPRLYCPWQGHTRVEGAVFYMRVMRGAAYTPPPATGMFEDLDPAWWGTKWAEAAYTAGIAPACSSAPLKYCASAPLTRDVAAFMLVGAKNLPLQ
ncbi:MAG: S-layer homology domain-containing protein [Chloroflexi bacterium]|nr:S-layer homology domain-containing protein [Chloroflexota bacterium]